MTIALLIGEAVILALATAWWVTWRERRRAYDGPWEARLSALGPGSYLVRFGRPGRMQYDRMIVVTDGGDTLFLQGWIGAPLKPAQWRAALQEHFPHVRRVQFERWNPLMQTMRVVTLDVTQ